MSKKALVVGINAYDPPNALPSCINDAEAFVGLLTDIFGFTSIANLRDKEASKAGMLQGLQDLLRGSQAGDDLVFYYSGHGYSYQQGTDYIEALVPQDADFLTSDDLAGVTKLAATGTLTVVLDSCFSGGMQKAFSRLGGIKPVMVKFWTPPHEDQAKAFAPEQPPIQTYKAMGSAPQPVMSTPLVTMAQPGAKAFSTVVPPVAGADRQFVMMSACQADETAAASTDQTNGRSAFTFALLDQIAQAGMDIGVSDLLDNAGRELRQLGVRQTPMLKAPSVPTDLTEHAFLLWDQPVPKIRGKSPMMSAPVAPPSSSSNGKGFSMPSQTFNKDWMSDIQSIVQTVTPIVASALKDYQPPSKGYVPNGQGSADKAWFDDLTRVVATIVPAVVQGMKDFQPPSKGFSAAGPQPFDKGWFDSITSIAAAVIPQVVSALKGYQKPGGSLSDLAVAAQKGWFDDVTHVVASVLPVIVSATKDLQLAGVSTSKAFVPSTPDDKGWLDVLSSVAQVAVPLALAVI